MDLQEFVESSSNLPDNVYVKTKDTGEIIPITEAYYKEGKFQASNVNGEILEDGRHLWKVKGMEFYGKKVEGTANLL